MKDVQKYLFIHNEMSKVGRHIYFLILKLFKDIKLLALFDSLSVFYLSVVIDVVNRCICEVLIVVPVLR